MPINNLIAQGIRPAQPISGFYQGQKDAQRGQMNNLAMQSEQLGMQNTRQNMDINRENMDMKKMAEYKGEVTKGLQWVDAQPDKKAAYRKIYPVLQQTAAKYGVDPTKISPELDEDKLSMEKQSWPSPATPDIKQFGDQDIMYRNGAEVGRAQRSQTASDKPSKWNRVAQLSRMIDAGKATKADKAEFDALTKPNVAVSIGSPTKNVTRIAKQVLPVLKVGDTKISGEIENEDAYLAAISTKGQAIQAESEKAGNPVSLEEAMRMAHDDMVAEGKLKDAKGVEIFGFTPFSKEFVYDPNPTNEPQQSRAQNRSIRPQENIGQPSDLKEGETGEFGGYLYKRQNGKLLKKAK